MTCWIDLANAYGSVRHNLIQFALEWYHVPKLVRDLILHYYELLMTKIQTKKWTTGFFLFEIGLFQGCVLSTILFDCVFQLLLDFLKPDNSKGFKFNMVPVQRLAPMTLISLRTMFPIASTLSTNVSLGLSGRLL